MISRGARVGGLALLLACSSWVRSTAALTCSDVSPRLIFTYPSEETPTLPQGAVFWAVGTNMVFLIEAYLDETLRLEPRGAAPPDNWLFVPPEPLQPGPHTIRFVFDHLSYKSWAEPPDEQQLDFIVADNADAAAGVDPNALAVALTAQRFSLPPLPWYD